MEHGLPAGREDGSLVLDAPRRITPLYALGLLGTVVLIGGISMAWLAGTIAALVILVSGGSLVPMMVSLLTGTLLGSGWWGLVLSLRGRLRTHDLSEAEALPDAFWILSDALQRLVRHTRAVRASIQEPDMTAPAIMRELFEWVTAVAEVKGTDRETLIERSLAPAVLRSKAVALDGHAELVPRAVELMQHFEELLLDSGGDPFRRGGRGRG